MGKASNLKLTPMMAQYQEIKADNPGSLLFFRLGDFYEMFGDDAIEASRLLEITLTARGSGDGRTTKIPMCGVPYHAAENYINKLTKLGKKVAIVEQTEDPKKAKGMVKRELVRIITPGTKLSPNSLEAKQNNFLAALAYDNGILGLAAADLSTGEFLVTELSGTTAVEDLLAELGRFQAAECLIPHDFMPTVQRRLTALGVCHLTEIEGFRFDGDAGRIQLTDYFKLHSLDGFGCQGMSTGLGAAAAIVYYLNETQKCNLAHIKKLVPYSIQDQMGLDDASIRNLELVRNAQNQGKANTLLAVLDHTCTGMGGRLLYHWLIRPLQNREELLKRQAAVAELLEGVHLRQAIKEQLLKLYDLERLAGRIGAGTATPKDLAALRNSLQLIPRIKATLAANSSVLLRNIGSDCPEATDSKNLLDQAIMDEPPLLLKDGGVIKSGYHQVVDHLRELTQQGKSYITKLQQQERERTGIGNLKIEYNNVFGYYIEVSKANSKLVPAEYSRKQTLVNAERYSIPQLKDYEQKVLTAQEKLVEIEQQLFQEIRLKILDQIQDIQRAAHMMAQLDVLAALAHAAAINHYNRPHITNSSELRIIGGRHPVVEQLVVDKFIPNDLLLNHDHNLISVITGPNMAGKSTYLRQNALIVIMAHIGSFVPADQAEVPIIDRVFTRVGATDNLAGGQSTFMVEMNETAAILNNATKKSLVILDEVGRGTSTFDGVSIAWAVVEYLHDKVEAKTLFATHYYELTELSLSKPKVKNNNIAVKEWQDEIIFLRKIVEGSADRSYGIQVARLAGLPGHVINRAKEVLHNLEEANYTENGHSRLAFHGSSVPTEQNSLFSQPAINSSAQQAVDQLRALAVDNLTPLEALNQLAKLKTLLD